MNCVLSAVWWYFVSVHLWLICHNELHFSICWTIVHVNLKCKHKGYKQTTVTQSLQKTQLVGIWIKTDNMPSCVRNSFWGNTRFVGGEPKWPGPDSGKATQTQRQGTEKQPRMTDKEINYFILKKEAAERMMESWAWSLSFRERNNLLPTNIKNLLL